MGAFGTLALIIFLLILGFIFGVLAVKLFHFSVFGFIDFSKNLILLLVQALSNLISSIKG